jgi:hypothetical protein
MTCVLLVTACSYTPAPVSVQGRSADLEALHGEWFGEYWSAESGRAGAVLFRLNAANDSAVGHVLMIPGEPGDASATAETPRPHSDYIGIRFVSADGGALTGLLDPYRDPACGCRLTTTFTGTMRGDTIAGTFSSRHHEGGDTQHGQWRVVRHSKGS